MGAVTDAITWASYETPLKAYLGVSGSSEDANLQLWLAAATSACDRYLNNPFDGSSDLAPSTIPTEVILGVYEYVRHARAILGEGGRSAGVMSVKTGDLSETYSAGVVNAVDAFKVILAAVKGAWNSWIYKFNR